MWRRPMPATSRGGRPMANDLDLTRPNLFVTIPMSKGDHDMNIPSRRSRGFKMSKQSRPLINWLKSTTSRPMRH